MLPLSCLKCEHCYDDDEALYCDREVCVKETGDNDERQKTQTDRTEAH